MIKMKTHIVVTGFFILISAIPLMTSTRAKVISKEGRWLTVNKGSVHGVETGMKGKVKMDIVDGGNRYDITIGLFSVKKVADRTSSLYVDRIGTGAKIGEAQYVIFDNTLKNPTVNKRDRIPAGKKVEWYLERGDSLFRERKYGQAKNHYQEALKVDRMDPVAKMKIEECDRKLASVKEEKKFYQYLEKAEDYLEKNSIQYALNYYLGAYQVFPEGKKMVAQRIQKIALEHKEEFEIFQKRNAEILDEILSDMVLSPEILAVLSGQLPFDKGILKKAKTAEKNSQGYWEVEYKFGPRMVYIPQGAFFMGSDPYINIQSSSSEGSSQLRGHKVDTNETPGHEVFLDGFFMAKFEVSNQDFIDFLNNDSKCTLQNNTVYCGTQEILKMFPGQTHTIQTRTLSNNIQSFVIDDRFADHPVANVSLEGAERYCQWLSEKNGVPFKIPTEAQWEKAARGTDKRIFPWGNHLPNHNKTFFANSSQSNTESDGFPLTAPVSAMPEGQSPYGIFHMSGNAAEWVADWYERKYYRTSPQRNPFNLNPQDISVLRKHEGIVRGGSWISEAIDLRVTGRDKRKRNKFYSDVGFRVIISTS